jgi:hypothetical protein
LRAAAERVIVSQTEPATMTATFNDWPLHDGVVYDVTVDWKQRTCQIRAAAFVERNAAAVPCILAWTGVRSVRVSMEEPWGRSVCVNSQEQAGQVFRIEMQSGDDIVIEAEAATMTVSSSDQHPGTSQGAG